MLHPIALLFIGVAVLFSVVVAALALRATIRTHHHVVQCSKIASELASHLAKSKKLEIEVGELGELCERLAESVNKWRGRAASNAKREAADNDVTKLKGAAWKEAMRARLKMGTPAIGGTSSEE